MCNQSFLEVADVKRLVNKASFVGRIHAMLEYLQNVHINIEILVDNVIVL